eukprot:4513352-Ditylum_brightwellii.AAC.1
MVKTTPPTWYTRLTQRLCVPENILNKVDSKTIIGPVHAAGRLQVPCTTIYLTSVHSLARTKNNLSTVIHMYIESYKQLTTTKKIGQNANDNEPMMGNTFCWDNNNDDVEEALSMETENLKDRESSWKRVGIGKG